MTEPTVKFNARGTIIEMQKNEMDKISPGNSLFNAVKHFEKTGEPMFLNISSHMFHHILDYITHPKYDGMFTAEEIQHIRSSRSSLGLSDYDITKKH